MLLVLATSGVKDHKLPLTSPLRRPVGGPGRRGPLLRQLPPALQGVSQLPSFGLRGRSGGLSSRVLIRADRGAVGLGSAVFVLAVMAHLLG